MGEVSRFRLSPSESRFTRRLLVALLWGTQGPCCSSPAGHAGLSPGLRPFQRAALWADGKEAAKGQPRLSSAGSRAPSAASPPGLSSPQSEPTELLNDSDEILRDDEDILRKMRRVMMMMAALRKTMLQQQAPYPVHLRAGESSDTGGV